MMKRSGPRGSCAVALLLASLALAGPASADKPSWAGGGKPDKQKAQEQDGRPEQHSTGRKDHDDRENRDADRPEGRHDGYFGDRHRETAREYYQAERRAGRCPPGLAKKRNGCQPPGQAKKWTRGRPLPRDVVFYDLPPDLADRFGPPPAGQRLVRVATDILLIAVGTGLVLDALEDLDAM